MDSAYQEFAGLLALSAVIGAIALRLRQPLIVAFIISGILVGPAVLGWVNAHEQIDLLAQIGVTVLLFVVGLKLDLHLVRNLGPVALATGLGQLLFTIVFGFLICLGLGLSAIESFYVAVALTFSSTIIIVKLLSDKREIDSLHGRIAMGFLIVQDIAVVAAMMLMGSQGAAEAAGGGAAGVALLLLLKMTGVIAVIGLLMRFVLPGLLNLLARSQELLLLFAIAWGTTLAATGDMLGFSKEVGAFLAGFSLASTTYREALSARLASIRDFLLLFFFVDLGSKLEFSQLGADLPAAMLLSAFVLIGNPLIVMAIMGYMGYRKRTGFLAGLTVAQISEFSIVFIAMGITLGDVDTGTLGLVTMVGLVTITLSTYMILYSQQLYGRLAPWLGVFERSRPYRELAVEAAPASAPADVIVFGLGRYGRRMVEQLQSTGLQVLGVDFDPETVRQRRREGMNVHFGDAEDPEFPESLPLGHATWIISTLPQIDLNLVLVRALKAHGYRGSLAMTAHHDPDATRLREAGVTRVLAPFTDAADFAAECIANELAKAGKV